MNCDGCDSSCACCCTCEDEDNNPGGSCAAGVPCPPFEDVTLEVLPGEPEPGAFARAAFGDEWTERTAAGYARRRRDVTSVTKMWFGEKHGWLTYEEAVAAGFEDRVTPLEHRGGAVTGFVEPGTWD